MHAIADTDQLVADGIISPAQAGEIERRARREMVSLAVNSILCLGILAATGGLIVWLGDPLSVALWGAIALACGLAILFRGGPLFAMFGHALALIGAGSLIGGACVELVQNHPEIAAQGMVSGGALLTLLTAALLLRRPDKGRFVLGAVFLMGVGAHLWGCPLWLEWHGITGPFRAAFYFYAFVLIAWAGWLVDVRLVTALAIVPFAQMLDTSTEYFHATYVFTSNEPTLSILQMCLLIAAMLVLASRSQPRTARHAQTLVMLAFVVANLCALVGSLFGDVVGEVAFGPKYGDFEAMGASQGDAYYAARDAFEAATLTISANVYSVLWALALIAMLIWAAMDNRRGLFNASLTFGAIHFYTQFFEEFGDEPLAWVIGGFLAIPLAWGIWRMDGWLVQRADKNGDLVG